MGSKYREQSTGRRMFLLPRFYSNEIDLPGGDPPRDCEGMASDKKWRSDTNLGDRRQRQEGLVEMLQSG
jgi:hypothetical protein